MQAFMVRVVDHHDGICGIVTDVATGETGTFRNDSDLIAVLDGRRPLHPQDESARPAPRERGAL